MTAAYFEDHPTDPDKVILRKPKHDFGEPWLPVSIGVDMTKEGAHVVGIYALDGDTSQIFYAKHHPAPQRTWIGLTKNEVEILAYKAEGNTWKAVELAEAKLKEKNT